MSNQQVFRVLPVLLIFISRRFLTLPFAAGFTCASKNNSLQNGPLPKPVVLPPTKESLRAIQSTPASRCALFTIMPISNLRAFTPNGKNARFARMTATITASTTTLIEVSGNSTSSSTSTGRGVIQNVLSKISAFITNNPPVIRAPRVRTIEEARGPARPTIRAATAASRKMAGKIPAPRSRLPKKKAGAPAGTRSPIRKSGKKLDAAKKCPPKTASKLPKPLELKKTPASSPGAASSQRKKLTLQKVNSTTTASSFPTSNYTNSPPSPNATRTARVYVLELEEGYIYVGKSKDPIKRIQQHFTGSGAAFTKAHPPTGRLMKRLGSLEGEGDGPERDETLRWMYKLGPERVRGWKYCTAKLTKADLKEVEANIREMYDLCRRCGRPGHFSMQCRYQTDRLGKSLRMRIPLSRSAGD